MATKKSLMRGKIVWLGVLLVTARLCLARANSGSNEEKRNPNHLAGTCRL